MIEQAVIPNAVSREDSLAASATLRVKEKALTALHDQLADDSEEDRHCRDGSGVSW